MFKNCWFSLCFFVNQFCFLPSRGVPGLPVSPPPILPSIIPFRAPASTLSSTILATAGAAAVAPLINPFLTPAELPKLVNFSNPLKTPLKIPLAALNAPTRTKILDKVCPNGPSALVTSLTAVKTQVRKSITPLIRSLSTIPKRKDCQALLRFCNLVSKDSKVFSNCFCDAPALSLASPTNSVKRALLDIKAIKRDCCLEPAAVVAI